MGFEPTTLYGLYLYRGSAFRVLVLETSGINHSPTFPLNDVDGESAYQTFAPRSRFKYKEPLPRSKRNIFVRYFEFIENAPLFFFGLCSFCFYQSFKRRVNGSIWSTVFREVVTQSYHFCLYLIHGHPRFLVYFQYFSRSFCNSQFGDRFFVKRESGKRGEIVHRFSQTFNLHTNICQRRFHFGAAIFECSALLT